MHKQKVAGNFRTVVTVLAREVRRFLSGPEQTKKIKETFSVGSGMDHKRIDFEKSGKSVRVSVLCIDGFTNLAAGEEVCDRGYVAHCHWTYGVEPLRILKYGDVTLGDWAKAAMIIAITTNPNSELAKFATGNQKKLGILIPTATS